MASIFISYRRSDSAGLAGRLYDRLERTFARDELFIDIDSIEAGADFTRVLDETLARCRIVLVMIGPSWLTTPDGQGGQRLDDPGDFVRREIEAALARDIAVVPVLVDGAVMPSAAQLPESLRKLSVRNAVEIRTSRFGPDADDLIRTLKARMKRERPRRTGFAIAASLVVLLGGGLGFAAYRGLPPFGVVEKTSDQRADAVRDDSKAAPVQGRLASGSPQSLNNDAVDAAIIRAPAVEPAPAPAEEPLRSASVVSPKQTTGLAMIPLAQDSKAPGPSPDGLGPPRTVRAIAIRPDGTSAPLDAQIPQKSAPLPTLIDIGEPRRVASIPVAPVRQPESTSTSDPTRVASAAPPERTPPLVPKAPAGPGSLFQDCENCPAMVVVPAGRFTIGSPPDERGRSPDEGPQREVIVPKAFAVSRTAISFDEWDACVAEGGCGHYRPGDYGWGRGRNPVIFVGFEDAQAYVQWLGAKAGQSYRLLSEAEWEYAARGCSAQSCQGQPFWFGAITPEKANYDWRLSYAGSPKAQGLKRTQAVDLGAANGFGLVQMLGNVRQWVQDCWQAGYGATVAGGDGAGATAGDCTRRVTRGGSWGDDPKELRAAARGWEVTGPRGRSAQIGFRVARAIQP